MPIAFLFNMISLTLICHNECLTILYCGSTFLGCGLFIMADTDAPEYIILKDHLADIIDLLSGNAPVIAQFSNHLFSSSLIPKEVHLNQKSSPLDRATQLINSVFSTIGTHSNPSSVFRGLVTSLEKVGLTDMAKKLQQSLGVKTHGIRPLIAAVSQSPTVIQLSSKDEVAQNIDSLYDQFSDLVTDLRDRFEKLVSEGKIKLVQVTRQAAEYLRRPVKSLQADDIDELFDSLQPHYDFLNCSLLRKLINKFLAGDELHLSLSQYINRMDKLLESSQLKHIRSAIKEKLSFLSSPTTGEHTILVVFELHSRWEELTLENFKRVLSHYFGSNADLFSHIYFDYGSLVVKMLIPTSILQFVADILIAKRSSMNGIGIFQVAISGRTMLSIDSTDINFEKSLMDSRDDFEATILLRLGANPSSEDDEGFEDYIPPQRYRTRRLLAISSEERATYMVADQIGQRLCELGDRMTIREDLLNDILAESGTVRFNQFLAPALETLMLRSQSLSIVSATIFGGVCGMAVTRLVIKINGVDGTFFMCFAVGGSVGAFAGTTAFDKLMGYPGGHSRRVTRYRIAVDVARTLLGIGLILLLFITAISVSFSMAGSFLNFRYNYETHTVSVFFGALMGAVSALTVGPEPIIGQISSSGYGTRSSVGLSVLRACIGIGTGAMVGSVALSNFIPYNYFKAATIFMGGLIGAFIGYKYCSNLLSHY
ncbi:PREDICTED: uncharacterized protein LOC109587077 [Amphimedon queenslandica]|uniref:Uncharacterized protein n=1 Tax=Amphimedon queenslandica TaxID=400682 RepID=A0AAN0JPB8_AMPQE|nr:PREDICTED: uncharacterized protein LOC109587077 [Amphimedon queenslandica]XP_019858855.1 PREDICTED: uncharacterized protein LOC109587077 [Amphimedon queenslandica]|eukprot:XP_019858854.1 PREDICTED: uncharacterized protein LOC109587077 [Amphimedon queenslandica]